jgi:hypothetical protein
VSEPLTVMLPAKALAASVVAAKSMASFFI